MTEKDKASKGTRAKVYLVLAPTSLEAGAVKLIGVKRNRKSADQLASAHSTKSAYVDRVWADKDPDTEIDEQRKN